MSDNPAATDADLLTYREAAKLLGVSDWTVRYHVRGGRLIKRTNGLRSVRLRRDDVLAFKAARETFA